MAGWCRIQDTDNAVGDCPLALARFFTFRATFIPALVTRLVFQGRLSDGQRFHWTIIRPGIVFFINHDESWTPPGAVRKDVKLCNMRGKSVDAVYFRNTQALNRARKECDARNISTFEGDVNLVARFLMERFIKGAVSFKSDPIRTVIAAYSLQSNSLGFIDVPHFSRSLQHRGENCIRPRHTSDGWRADPL